MNPNFIDYLLKVTKSTECKESETIQPLWSDYGRISRYQLDNSSLNTVVVKFISLNQSNEHPRGWNTEYSHNRKVKSYKVETNWYEKWSQLCNDNCKIPKLIGSFSEGNDQWIVLEDLNLNFPLRKKQLQFKEVKVCLKWLANFHATFLNHNPNGLWEIGTYWHLKTRPDEFKNIEHQELKSKAHLIDDLLNQCKYQTIVHGDAKLANFCFSENGESVAAVDFQYVGGGCGIKDVAYFLGSCLSGSECELYQDELLDFYFSQLESSLNSLKLKVDFKELEQEWRKMYPIACTDFMRFMLGWMPSHQKINDYNLNIMNSVLSSL
ncbi:oxidoreductase family protein [Aquimarina sp. 2201CG5-10]|uniref:oxidoreductase family protein n=1 Tax=Aquimarina callyspongiae TaxID=3098150 RepID=UPI002AB55210|nr:oxidoreductase family protein [Aquimarina sp. 2201CG5-10]MDY8137264.1 oxidoreductase family protein [Aquimarina sp. 2201CG5-10]